MSLPLFVDPSLSPPPSASQLASILADIRSTSYIDEASAGDESSREDSALYDAVVPSDLPSGVKTKRDITAHVVKGLEGFSTAGYVLVDHLTLDERDGSVVVVELDSGDSMRVARRSLIEVVSRGRRIIERLVFRLGAHVCMSPRLPFRFLSILLARPRVVGPSPPGKQHCECRNDIEAGAHSISGDSIIDTI